MNQSGSNLRSPNVDDAIRLTQDIPELMLYRGDVGIVRSTWFAPFTRYEVEFERSGQSVNTRALLKPEQIQLEEPQKLEEPVDSDWFDPISV